MSSKNSALASLTAQYTDSENEDDGNISEDDDSSDGFNQNHLQVMPFYKLYMLISHVFCMFQSKPSTPPAAAVPELNKSHSKAHLRLVSYNDDNVVSDDETGSPPNREANVNMDISEEEDYENNGNRGTTVTGGSGSGSTVGGTSTTAGSANTTNNDAGKEGKTPKKDKFSEYGFNLPPEPKGKCPHELQDKITNMYDKMKQGMDMNRVIQDRKEFRNPSIYEKLIQFCDINELGTNYAPEIYDPLQWGMLLAQQFRIFLFVVNLYLTGKESFYEELARVQKIEMEKREKDRKDNMKQELAIAVAKKAEEDAKKR